VIRFLCDCGRAIKVEDGLAGHRVQCSKCGAKMRVPKAQPLSAPEALAATMRQANQPQPEEVETTEVPEEEVPKAVPVPAGLDALAQAVKSVPTAKTPARPTALVARSRGPIGPAAGVRRKNGRNPAPGAKRLSAAVIAVIASAAGLIVLIVILCLLGGGGGGTKGPDIKPQTSEPPNVVVETPKPKRYVGPQPGELFPKKPFEDPDEQTPPKKP